MLWLLFSGFSRFLLGKCRFVTEHKSSFYSPKCNETWEAKGNFTHAIINFIRSNESSSNIYNAWVNTAIRVNYVKPCIFRVPHKFSTGTRLCNGGQGHNFIIFINSMRIRTSPNRASFAKDCRISFKFNKNYYFWATRSAKKS